MSKILKWIDHNRCAVVAIALSMVLWFVGFACVPTTKSPTRPSTFVTADELQDEYTLWQAERNVAVKKFERAEQDLQKQTEQQAKLTEIITNLASGQTPNLPGLIQMLVGGGFLGLLGDNVRKGGVIGGLKRNA